jgi:hypothetical protein
LTRAAIVTSNLFVCARERDSSAITLVAAHRALVPVLNTCGFDVENSELGRQGMALGIGIPMVAR